MSPGAQSAGALSVDCVCAQAATQQSRLAACLATPGMTGQERSMGELLNDTVRRFAAQSDMSTQQRCAPGSARLAPTGIEGFRA